MSSKSVALILGAGPRVGSAVASKFASKGYAVAIASRRGSGAVNADGYLTIKADLTKTESIKDAFGAAKAQFGSAPSIVVYNAAALTPPPVSDSPLSIPAESFVSDLTLNTISPYVAAQQAVEGWATLPQDVTKAFIYTGNVLNVQILPVPLLLTLGVGKSASAYWIGTADAAYADKGYRFFYADERKADGSNVGQGIDGEAHGEFFAQLAAGPKDVPWHATFVKGQGYTKF